MELPVSVALVAIDLQNGIFAGKQPVHDAVGVLQRAQLVIDAAADAGRPVVLVQDDAGPGLWEPDTPGWELHPAITAPAGAILLRKMFGDAFRNTSLHEQLSAGGVTHLVVLGAMTDFSVRSTLQRALLKGYHTTLVVDAHSTLDGIDGPATEQIELLNHEVGAATAKRLPLRGERATAVADAFLNSSRR